MARFVGLGRGFLPKRRTYRLRLPKTVLHNINRAENVFFRNVSFFTRRQWLSIVGACLDKRVDSNFRSNNDWHRRNGERAKKKWYASYRTPALTSDQSSSYKNKIRREPAKRETPADRQTVAKKFLDSRLFGATIRGNEWEKNLHKSYQSSTIDKFCNDKKLFVANKSGKVDKFKTKTNKKNIHSHVASAAYTKLTVIR